HIGGLNGTVNPTLLRGGSVVLVRGFDPPATLAVISEQRVTSFFAAGTMLDSADAVAKVGSAGKSQFFVDVRVVRPDGTECEPGEIGEVVLSGPNIMAGYWNAPEETAAAIVDGWYHSGDAGSTDADGY